MSLPFLIVAGLFGLDLVFGFLLVNPLAQKLLPWIGENKFASHLSAGHRRARPADRPGPGRGSKMSLGAKDRRPQRHPLTFLPRPPLEADSSGAA